MKIKYMIFVFLLILLIANISSTKWTTVNSLYNYTFDESASIGSDTGTGGVDLTTTGFTSEPSGCVHGSCVSTGVASYGKNDSAVGEIATGGISLWIKPNINTTKMLEPSCLVNSDPSGNSKGNFNLGIVGNVGYSCGGGGIGTGNGTITFYFNNVTGVQFIETTSNFTKDTWYHIYAKINSTAIALFVNGAREAIGYGSPNQAMFGNDYAYFLGVSGASGFNGTSDELKIYNTELTEAQILDLYNTEFAGIGAEINLVITLSSPGDALESVGTSNNFTANFSVSSISSVDNSTFYFWDSDGDLLNQTFNTVSALTNSTTVEFSEIPYGANEWNYYVCGSNSTATECSFATSNFTYTRSSYSVDNYVFNPNIYETSKQTFALNITTDPTLVSIYGKLNYNGTDYSSSSSCNSMGFCNLTVTLDVPTLPESLTFQNRSFFWNITVYNGTSSFVDSTSNDLRYQYVNELGLGRCNATYTIFTINLTSYDEKNLTRINPFYSAGNIEYWLGSGSASKNYSFSNLSVADERICLERNLTYYINANIEYAQYQNGTGYKKRNYYFDNSTLTNITNNLSLYLLHEDYSTSFILEVLDIQTRPVVDALVYIMRYYPGSGLYKIVQVAKTDANGKSNAFYEVETAEYMHLISKDGVNLLTTDKQKVVPESSPYTLSFTTGTAVSKPWDSFELNSSWNTALSYNDTTKMVTFSYIDLTSSISFGRLLVEQLSATNRTITICDINSTQPSASLQCNLTDYSGNFVAKGYLGNNPSTLERVINFIISSAIDTFGKTGLFVAFILILTVAMAFIWSPTAMIISTNLTFVALNLIGIIAFSPTVIFSVLGVSLLLIILIKI